MARSAAEFARLLTKAIHRIRAETGDTISGIQDEICTALGKEGGSIIEYWRKGNLPAELSDLEQLARELVRRDGLRKQEELEQFLEYGGHVQPDILSKELFSQQPATNQQPLYKRHYMHISRQLSIDGLVISSCQTEIEVLQDQPLSSIRHKNWAAIGKYEDFQLGFKMISRHGGGSIRTRIMKNDPELVLWRMEFRPPLLKNQRASYIHTQSFRGECTLTYEECYKQYKQGLRPGDFEFYRHTIRVPTDEFKLAMVFPPGYPISLPPSGGFAVYVGQSEHLQETAKLRVMDSFSMTYDDATDRWSIELIARPAYIGFGYQIRWVPPEAAFITNHR